MVIYECRVSESPYFNVIIEELWPDTDQASIIQLFGADSLDWWNSLSPTEQERRTLSRGLEVLSVPPTTAQLNRRSAQLTSRIQCDLAGDRACNWQPTRPGFYRLTGVGAWMISRVGSRRWAEGMLSNYFGHLTNHLSAATENGICPTGFITWHNTPRNRQRMNDKDCIRADLRTAGFTAPSDVGLLNDLSDVLPSLTDRAALFNEDLAPTAACRPLDFRVVCSSGLGTGNYTETEPIGIMVHEVRVSTVMPDN